MSGKHARENSARRAVAHARDFNRKIFFHQVAKRARVLALESLGFRNRRAKPDGEIVRHMVAADRNRRRVPDDSSGKSDHVGCAAADIKQAAAQLALVLREARFGGASGSSTVSSTRTPARFTAVTMFCVAEPDAVTM